MSFLRRAPKPLPAVARLSGQALDAQYARVRSLSKRELALSWWSTRILFGVALAEGAVIVGLTYSLVAITPNVRLVPMFTWIRADGTAAAQPAMSMLPVDRQDAQIRATLWQYVLWREGYSFDTAEFRRNIVVALSDDAVAAQYTRWFNYPNPDSPQTWIGHNGTITIEQAPSDFTSDPNVYQVNYWRTVKINGQPPRTAQWTAFVHFKLVSTIPVNERTSINPSGIKVTSYPPPVQVGAPPTPEKKVP